MSVLQKIKDLFIPPVKLTDEFMWVPVREVKELVLLEKRRKVLIRGTERWIVCKKNSYPVRKWTNKRSRNGS